MMLPKIPEFRNVKTLLSRERIRFVSVVAESEGCPTTAVVDGGFPGGGPICGAVCDWRDVELSRAVAGWAVPAPAANRLATKKTGTADRVRNMRAKGTGKRD